MFWERIRSAIEFEKYNAIALVVDANFEIDMEPVYGGKSYLEKADYIVQKLCIKGLDDANTVFKLYSMNTLFLRTKKQREC